MKKALLILLSLFLVCCMSGCDFLTADTAELLSAPELSGELSPIAEVVEKTAGGQYTLQYPSRGDYRSAVIKTDINGDEIEEAFAFYSITEGENVTMHLNVIAKREGEWQSVATQKIIAGGVDRVEFCDLDNDGIKEILVGWEIYGTSEMQLAVYGLGENSLTQRLLQRYTHYVTCDLNKDTQNEILIVKTATAEQNNSASLFSLSEDGITEISSCRLDNGAKTVNHPIVAELSDGRPAVYIDEYKGVGAVTEVLFMDKDVLVNPLLDKKSFENVATLRAVSLETLDINEDGVLEIPVQRDVPSVTRSELNEKLYLTDWCSFNGDKLTVQMTAMMNIDDGYYYIIPTMLRGKIAVLKDTENHIREIYSYNPKDLTVGESLMYIKTVVKKDWDEGKYKSLGAGEIMNDGETSYICKITEKGKTYGLTLDSVISNFKITD